MLRYAAPGGDASGPVNVEKALLSPSENAKRFLRIASTEGTPMSHLARTALIVSAGLIALAALIAIGFRIKPKTAPPADLGPPHDLGTVPLPPDLPAPVRRHHEAVFGERVPVIRTAVVWGAPRFRLGPLWARLPNVTYYAPGQHYREMEIRWFGIPVIRGHEYHRDGKAAMHIGGRVIDGPSVDQGGCLGSWGEELLVIPSVFVTAPGVRWEPIDEAAARLIVPCGAGEERFTVAFDPDTGLMSGAAAMRYRGQETEKTLWTLEFAGWQEVDGWMVPTGGSGRWADERQPYTIWSIGGMATNVDISEHIPSAPDPAAE
jgi:hypothetical protein